MRIAVSGTSGLLGSALATALAVDHEVLPIRRRGGGGIAWDGGVGFEAAALRGCQAIVHLAGAGIGDRRWSAARMHEIRESRVRPTAALAGLLAADPGAVRVLVVASGAGWYGERGEEAVDETAPAGAGFLAAVCRDWEAAADACRSRVRVVHLRLGVVLSAAGGALPRLAGPARWGLAGALGSGRQWWPWIGRGDAVRAIAHVLGDETLVGACNVVAPEPIRQGELARAVAAALGRPALAPPAPRLALRLLVGRMADEALLTSTRAVPTRLRAAGFAWRQAALPDLLRAELAT